VRVSPPLILLLSSRTPWLCTFVGEPLCGCQSDTAATTGNHGNLAS
jgi:hypothetical protein